MMQAIRCTRKGGYVSYVGVPHGVELNGEELFFAHVHLHVSLAPVRRFLPRLIGLVWNGKINPGKIFGLTLPLDQVAESYRAMDERRVIKTLLRRKALSLGTIGLEGAEMKLLAATLISISLYASTVLQAQTGAAQVDVSSSSSSQLSRSISITRCGSQQSTKGPAEYFTGSVQVEPVFSAHDPSRASGGKVTFEPGARSAWHTHPLGQILMVTAGTGWIQQWGGRVEEIRKGDVVWTPAGVKHWHGATPNTAMTHIAIQEQLNGKVVEWMEKVTDEQYRK